MVLLYPIKSHAYHKCCITSMEHMILLYCIMSKRSINVGKIILKEIQECANKRSGSAYFPSLITSLCRQARVQMKKFFVNFYNKGIIFANDITRVISDYTGKKPITDDSSKPVQKCNLRKKFFQQPDCQKFQLS